MGFQLSIRITYNKWRKQFLEKYQFLENIILWWFFLSIFFPANRTISHLSVFDAVFRPIFLRPFHFDRFPRPRRFSLQLPTFPRSLSARTRLFRRAVVLSDRRTFGGRRRCDFGVWFWGRCSFLRECEFVFPFIDVDVMNFAIVVSDLKGISQFDRMTRGFTWPLKISPLSKNIFLLFAKNNKRTCLVSPENKLYQSLTICIDRWISDGRQKNNRRKFGTI